MAAGASSRPNHSLPKLLENVVLPLETVVGLPRSHHSESRQSPHSHEVRIQVKTALFCALGSNAFPLYILWEDMITLQTYTKTPGGFYTVEALKMFKALYFDVTHVFFAAPIPIGASTAPGITVMPCNNKQDSSTWG